MDTVSRGNAAEAAVLNALVGGGIPVLLPFGDGLWFDLAAVLPDGEILRVQVKSGRIRKDVIEFNSCTTDHGRGRLSYRGRADVIAVHVAALDRVYMVPVGDCPSYRGYLRLGDARNNQRARVRYAETYEFAAWSRTMSASEAAGGVEPAVTSDHADRDHL